MNYKLSSQILIIYNLYTK